MNIKYSIPILLFLIVLLLGSAGKPSEQTIPSAPVVRLSDKPAAVATENSAAPTGLEPAMIIDKYQHRKPNYWGEQAPGVKTRLSTNEAVLALTLDACGGPGSSGYDQALINYLVDAGIPATLFINSRWIDANPDVFSQLAANPLFEIENHGTRHQPLSVNGRSAYCIKGTANVKEVIQEIMENNRKIEPLIGRRPCFFRPGTAFCDEIAVMIAQDLGCQVVGYSTAGDGGATFTEDQVMAACLKSKPGDIILCHMNHPGKGTAAGLKRAIPKLHQRGFQFVKLQDYPLQ